MFSYFRDILVLLSVNNIKLIQGLILFISFGNVIFSARINYLTRPSQISLQEPCTELKDNFDANFHSPPFSLAFVSLALLSGAAVFILLQIYWIRVLFYYPLYVFRRLIVFAFENQSLFPWLSILCFLILNVSA